MLARLDKAVAVLSWVVAALVVLLLAVGPHLIAEDEGQPGAAGASGETVFVESCGTCHTLSAAGTSGQIGPSLDEVTLSAADVEAVVEEGRGGMPSFAGSLSSAEIAAVAGFVAESGSP